MITEDIKIIIAFLRVCRLVPRVRNFSKTLPLKFQKDINDERFNFGRWKLLGV